MKEIQVDIWSDIACPWCYIGKRRFEKGIEQYQATEGALPIRVTYHSYQLSPDLPLVAEKSQAEYLSAHKSITVEQAAQMMEQVVQVAETENLKYDMDAVHMVNTRPAHRLLHYAKTVDKQSEMSEALFDAYFVRGISIADTEVLKALAADVGLESDAVDRALSEAAFDEAVDEDIRQAKEIGVPSVPFFVLNNTYGMTGAQSADQYAEVFAKVVTMETQGE